MGAMPSKGRAMDGAACSSPTNEAATTTTTYSRWSDLTPDLAGLVVNRLPSNDDRIRFSSVCRQWRRGAREWSPPAPALPWINYMDCEDTFQSLRSGNLRHVRMPDLGMSAHTTCFGSSDNWLLFFVTGVAPHQQCVLKNPISQATLTLPREYDHAPEEVLDIRSFIACSSSNLIVANVHTADGPAVACYRPGRSSWSARSCGNTGEKKWRYRYEGIAFHHGKVYGVNKRGQLFVHEVIMSDAEDENNNHPTLSLAKKVIDRNGMIPFVNLYLVASSCTGKLLMVHVTDAMSFELFEADLETSRWKKMQSLGDDEVLFVSGRFSKSVSAAGRHDGGHNLRRNHIYFLGGYYSFGSVVCGMYDLSNATFRPVPFDHLSNKLSAAWFFPRRE